jgi:RNA polymerase I-specific transcription initiation factor RRN5
MSSASESEPEPELDAVSGADHNSRTLSRRRSSTSQSPRKRPRLRSTDSSRFRNHKVLRKPELEAKYNDNYRLLFNDQVAQATARFDVDVAKEEEQGFSKHVGSSVWLSQEQAVFFAALERLGPDDTPGIACAIRTKTAVEVRAFLVLLQDAATKQGDANLTLRDIPAAIEVGDSCHQELEEAGDALAWYQERQEALQEQERYGEHWLITPSIAQEIEDAYSGFIHLRAASAIQEDEPKEFGSGVAGYVHAFAHSLRSF